MPLVNAKEMLTKAKAGQYAVGQFNINNLEWTKAILLTAQEMNSPVILGVSEGAGKYMCGYNTVVGMVEGMLDNLGIKYKVGVDEAAFYGPKLDIQIKNVFGKEDTLITIQIDLLLAKKFGMEYTDSDNTQKTPYIIHRTSLGCYERTLALLLEKYAGALPLWLSPTQVTVLPVSNTFDAYSEKVYRTLQAAGIRVEHDNRNEKLGYRMREAQLDKVPYMVTVGFNEQEQGTVSVRSRRDGDLGVMKLDDFLARLDEEIKDKKK